MSMFKKNEEQGFHMMDVDVYENLAKVGRIGKQMILDEIEDSFDDRKTKMLIEFLWEFYEDLIAVEQMKAMMLNDLYGTLEKLDNLDYKVSSLKDAVYDLQTEVSMLKDKK